MLGLDQRVVRPHTAGASGVDLDPFDLAADTGDIGSGSGDVGGSDVVDALGSLPVSGQRQRLQGTTLRREVRAEPFSHEAGPRRVIELIDANLEITLGERVTLLPSRVTLTVPRSAL